MSPDREFHVLTVGWGITLVEQLGNLIESKGRTRFSNAVHPKYTRENWPQQSPQSGIYYFREKLEDAMPAVDRQLLGSLERDGVPTVHNMILGDRVVSKLAYDDALRYATFLAQRLLNILAAARPDTVLIGFDSLHSSLALAVAKHLGIPVYALHFSALPTGMACFCDRMSPAARVTICERPASEQLGLAERALKQFEAREIAAHAYMPPAPSSVLRKIGRLPARVSTAVRTTGNARKKEFLKFTEKRNSYSVLSAVRHMHRISVGRRAVMNADTLREPPRDPFVLFGLHFQPESSIDVWAPFFSNQMWVIELLSRSIPATHKLLVKIHKSDITSYPRAKLDQMRAFPGVELVAPFADTRKFLERADLLIAIQGTLGLEAALLGKPVIMLGDSPVSVFPNASEAGSLRALPALVRKKLEERPPGRSEIIDAYASYLTPFFPASPNNWKIPRKPEEISGYAVMFDTLGSYLNGLSKPAAKNVAADADSLLRSTVRR